MSVHAIVRDIPYADYFAKEGNYSESFKLLLDRVAVSGTKISFLDDKWDFNPYYDRGASQTYRICFEAFGEPLKTQIKFYVLDLIRRGNKPSTASSRVSCLRCVVAALAEKPRQKSFETAETKDFVNAVEKDAAPRTILNRYMALCDFLDQGAKRGMLEFSDVEIDFLRERKGRYFSLASGQQERRKTPDIPSEYYDHIVAAMTKVMRNPSVGHDDRAVACLVLVLSQTGLRIGDLLALETSMIKVKRLPNLALETHYLNYSSRKPSRGTGPLLKFNIFCTELCYEALRTLEELRPSCTVKEQGDYLFALDHRGSSKDVLPVHPNRFREAYQDLLVRELPEMTRCNWRGVEPRKIRGKGSLYYIPQTSQYRVRVCTMLYEARIPLQYIRKFMGHLSCCMEGYYARPADVYRESVAEAESFIRALVVEDARLLGGSSGDEVKRRVVDQFVANGNPKTAKDIKGIVASLGEKISIRGKTGGVCVKTSILSCARDWKSDELLCAFGLCPNLYHFYFHLDVSLVDFETMKATYVAACEAGRIREADKELGKIKDVCRRRVTPELRELKSEVESKGVGYVVERHPSLAPILDSLPEIEGDVAAWLAKDR